MRLYATWFKFGVGEKSDEIDKFNHIYAVFFFQSKLQPCRLTLDALSLWLLFVPHTLLITVDVSLLGVIQVIVSLSTERSEKSPQHCSFPSHVSLLQTRRYASWP